MVPIQIRILYPPSLSDYFTSCALNGTCRGLETSPFSLYGRQMGQADLQLIIVAIYIDC